MRARHHTHGSVTTTTPRRPHAFVPFSGGALYPCFCMVAGRRPPLTTPNNKCNITRACLGRCFGLWPTRALLKSGQNHFFLGKRKKEQKDRSVAAQRESGARNREKKKKSVRVADIIPLQSSLATAPGMRSTLGALKHLARWRKGTPVAAFPSSSLAHVSSSFLVVFLFGTKQNLVFIFALFRRRD